jgi:fatty-acyl-CoA synthase
MPQLPLTTSYWPADTTSPVLPTTIGGALRTAASRAPGQVALIAGSPDPARRREWRYGELLAEAERGARALRARFGPGERIAVQAGNCPEWVLLEFAAGLAGLTLVMVNPACRSGELAHALGHAGVSGIFLAAEHQGTALPGVLATIRDRLPALREVIPLGGWAQFCAPSGDGSLPAVDPGQPAQILYTSGTTGRPRAAVLTHRGLTNNARLAAEVLGMRAGETLVNPMPLFHVAGCGLLTLGLVQSLGTHVLMPHFDPGLQLELIETYRGTALGGVPAMLAAVLRHPSRVRRDLSSLRYAIAGGAPVPAPLARQLETALDVPLVITFGQTESSCSITATGPGDRPTDRAETLGRPLPQTEVKIIDPRTGQTADCGTAGEICTRGYLVMDGYLDDPAATSAAIDAAGWLHTGDAGAMDERGYCRISGRLKEMIIRDGENICPRAIEEVFPLTATGPVRKDVLSAWLAGQPGRAPARRQAGDSVAAHADGGPQC